MAQTLEFHLRIETPDEDHAWRLTLEWHDAHDHIRRIEFGRPLDALAYLEALGRWPPPEHPGLK